jgi:uncharacterized alkaline shock family protein YloU
MEVKDIQEAETQGTTHNDKVTIAPAVMLTVVRYAALGVKGVARMGNMPGGVDRIFRRNPAANGVMIVVDDEEQTVVCDLYIVVQPGVNMREISYNVQQKVSRAIHEIIGMEVLAINVHIEDVAYDTH